MSRLVRLLRDPRGATIIETAFALPVLISMIWAIFQAGLVFRANSGIQHALGEGARLATLFPTPSRGQIESKMQEAVYGVGPGTFTFQAVAPVDNPLTATIDESKAGYFDLTVTYGQNTDLIFLPAPRMTIRKSKRVWVAGSV